jgi:hypothetical protein
MPGEKMISPERIHNAHYAAEVAYRYDNHIRPAIVAALEADDSFRASTPPVDPQEKEPELPIGATFINEKRMYGDACYDARGKSVVCGWSASDLRKIAKHIEWRSRPKPAPVPEVSDEMVEAAFRAAQGDAKHYREHFRNIISAALSAHASGSDGKEK